MSFYFGHFQKNISDRFDGKVNQHVLDSPKVIIQVNVVQRNT